MLKFSFKLSGHRVNCTCLTMPLVNSHPIYYLFISVMSTWNDQDVNEYLAKLSGLSGRANWPYSHKLLTINNYVNCPSNFAFPRSICLFDCWENPYANTVHIKALLSHRQCQVIILTANILFHCPSSSNTWRAQKASGLTHKWLISTPQNGNTIKMCFETWWWFMFFRNLVALSNFCEIMQFPDLMARPLCFWALQLSYSVTNRTRILAVNTADRYINVEKHSIHGCMR